MLVPALLLCASAKGAAAQQQAEAATPPSAPNGGLDAAEFLRMRRELDELKADVEASNAAAENVALEEVEDPFRFYGFIDMGLRKLFIPKNNGVNRIAPTRATSFLLGNINLYFDVKPTREWGTLIEVRLTNYPDGNDSIGTPFDPYTRTDTTVRDTNNGDGFDDVKYGSIILERAYIEWSGHDRLNARVGYFLTPAGIWNVDHGSPTLIPINFPEVITSELYPRKQLGLQVYGTLAQPLPWIVSYNAYVSNGRSPGQWDLTEDKMLGGRVYATKRQPTIMVGVSGYAGRYSDQIRAISSFEPLVIDRTETVAFNEKAFGADLSLDLADWRLRAEGVVRQQVYVPNKRFPAAAPGTFLPDRTQIDVYAIVSRMFSNRLEPYFYGEFFKAEEEFVKYIIAPSVGLNYHFNPSVILKFQYHRDLTGDKVRDIIAPDEFFGGKVGFHLLAARLVMAF